jgi:hypothetical protein
MDLATLEAIEEIKKLKARYFRLMDQRKWDGWPPLFTKDVYALYEMGPKYGLDGTEWNKELSLNGAEQITKGISEFLAGGISIHQGFMPEIEVTSPTTAHGIWAMHDYLSMPSYEYDGFGHYEEDYVRQDGVWKIKKLVLTRVYYEVTWREGFPAK